MNIYRVKVEFPTPDGKPFEDQPEELFQEGVDAYNGAEGETPPWFPDNFDDWLGSDGPYQGIAPPDRPGYWFRELGLMVPVIRRVHYFSGHAAEVKAAEFREWGCTVTVEKSRPVQWGCDCK